MLSAGRESFLLQKSKFTLILWMCWILTYRYWLPEGICVSLEQNSFSIWKRRQLQNQTLKHFELHCLKPYDPLHLLSEWHELQVSPCLWQNVSPPSRERGRCVSNNCNVRPYLGHNQELGADSTKPSGEGNLVKAKWCLWSLGKGKSHPNWMGCWASQRSCLGLRIPWRLKPTRTPFQTVLSFTASVNIEINWMKGKVNTK